MSDSGSRGEARVEAALEALARYREGRARRARDGGVAYGDGEVSGIECLLERAPVADQRAAHHRRRIELVEDAVRSAGVERELAEEVYDIAREEGVEPAFAFELVRCGVAVCGPEEMPEAEAISTGRPPWLEPPVPGEEAARERRLRNSFRRLRGLLERHGSPEEALVEFAREPDVEECDY